jgi:hypothetical protein
MAAAARAAASPTSRSPRLVPAARLPENPRFARGRAVSVSEDRAGQGQPAPMPRDCARCRLLPSVDTAGATMTSTFWNSLMEL